MREILKKEKKEVLLIFVLLDLLFLNNVNLPILPTMPISLLLIILYCIFNPSIIKRNRVFKPFLLFVFFLIISMFFGILFNPPYTHLGAQVVSVTEYNIKRTLQIIILFMYLFFSENVQLDKKMTKKIFSVFILWYLFLGVLSTINLSRYFSIHNLIYGATISKVDYYLNYETLNVFRYRYIFLDANTSIYFFLLITSYLLILNKNSKIYNIFIHLANILAIFLSQSTGATISLIIFYFMYFIILPIFKRKKTYNRNKILISTISISAISITLLLGAVLYTQISNFNIMGIDFIQSGYERISSNDGGGRFEKYLYLFQDRLPFLWGEGYVIVRDGMWFRPHSDILRMLYSFGIIPFLLFIYMFRKISSLRGFTLFIPSMIAFAANSLIDDQKLFAMFLVIYAFYSKENLKSKKMLE